MSDPFPVPDMADVEIVDLLRAVADPIRLRLLVKLAEGDELPKGPLVWEFDVQKSTLAHHFKTMREAGLTRTLIDGRSHRIQLRRAELEEKFPGLVDALVASAKDLGD